MTNEVYPLADSGYWVWRHRCPKSGSDWRQYHPTQERAARQAAHHQRFCDSYVPFFPGMDILMYVSPDWRPYASGG